MGILRSISLFVRNVITKQHPYFSCCASCGEIKLPLQQRLCTSLMPDYPVDALIIGQAETQAQQIFATHTSLCAHFPWVRQFFLVTPSPIPPNLPKTITTIEPELLANCSATLPAAAWLHTISDLADHYLIVEAGIVVTQSAHPLDFFTPNGIPLLPLDPNAQHTPVHILQRIISTFAEMGLTVEPGLCPAHDGITPQYKAFSAAFCEFSSQTLPLDEEEYYWFSHHFSYASQHCVPHRPQHIAKQ